MAMFDNPKKELAELEQQLLKEEEWFNTELAQAKALIGEEPAKKAPKAKAAPASQKAAPKKAAAGKAPSKKAEKKKSNRGLITLAILETLGIVGIVAYWLLFLL